MNHFLPHIHRLLALVLAAVFLWLDSSESFQLLESRFFDRAMRAMTRPVGDQVTLVTIDEADLERFGPWPLSWRHLTRLIEILHRGNPRVLGIAFPIQDDPNNKTDAELQPLETAFRTAGNVVLNQPAEFVDLVKWMLD
ncbi:MAG: CHASE2 domain-containing protein, partial [Magnetococcales bacterium]|nr:CHASE2 domain-containing protein [Magnetococcales bacterium]